MSNPQQLTNAAQDQWNWIRRDQWNWIRRDQWNWIR